MLIRILSAKCVGVNAMNVDVEVQISPGIGIHLVGLADIAVKESLLRTTTALESLGYHVPGRRITINLAPADLQKNGSGYDLPIALGIIAASEQRNLVNMEKYLIMGELGLNGAVRPIPGALPYAELAEKEGLSGIILPEESALEATEFGNISVFGVKTLDDVVKILEGNEDASDFLIQNTQIYRKLQRNLHHGKKVAEIPDFSEIIGQEGAKRGMEIAAAGGHNVILLGSPGSGKSSLARAMAGIMPPLTREESLMTSKIYSIVGRRDARFGLMRQRPFRSPHCSSSLAAMIGGGSGECVSPGEVSLAHNGILFIDEFTQMPKSVAEALRAPMEDRKVVISRLRSKVEYPASFMLVAASNPCPCGYWGDGDRCTCTPYQRMTYLSKISGPIQDRVDVQIWCKRVSAGELAGAGAAESSAVIAGRVLKARIIQKDRFMKERESGIMIMTNAEMNNRQIERYCPLSQACKDTLTRLMEKMGLSLRAYFRIIKVARTIADLAGENEISPRHIAEAAGYRFLDRDREF